MFERMLNTSLNIVFSFVSFGTKYSRMDQVKFAEENLKKFAWSTLQHFAPFISMQVVLLSILSYNLPESFDI